MAEGSSRDKGSFYGFPSLAAAFDTAVHEYETEREGFVRSELAELGGEADRTFSLIEAAAEAFIRGAGDLVSLDSVPTAREVFQKDLQSKEGARLADLISERVAIELGKEAVTPLKDGVKRTWLLVALSQPVEPSGRAAEFLKHVSRCYVYGFMAECVILCRSVLDAEFGAEISTDECIDTLGPRRPPYFVLDDRIAVAVKRGRISPETAGCARTVQETGNRTVHRKPDNVSDAMPIIALTLHVIRELNGTRSG